MDFKQAKAILESRLADNTFTGERLLSIGWYLSVSASEDEATLDGSFTADELEAIAVWMRNPQACFEA